ncbi:hypothetical protein Leryth_012003 [Lithospermum erythrorhizon]|nr:hypothetical protein Leryth_012003 [Lithospermum erythrorhizon]
MSKGISGTAEGFDLQGRRLGGTFPQPSLPFLSRTALVAAEKRAKLNQLFPSGPVRLGGDRSMLALNPRQAAAMAAERRLLDNTWCGSESFDENDTTDQEPLAGCGKSKTSLELDERVLHESSLKRARVFRSNFTNRSSSSCPLDVEELFITSMSSQTGVGNGTQSTGKFSTWECSKCTLLNPALAPVCELCSTHRPKDVDTKYNSWSCKICTLDNDVKLEACGACGNWRYSTGPPVATLTTNLGT